jgi:beta-glucosidase
VNEAYSVPLTHGIKDAGFSVHAGLEEVYEIYIAEQKGRRAPPPMPFMPQQPIAEMVTSSEAVGRWCAETDMALITITRSSGEFLDRKRDGDFYLSEAEKALVLSVSSVFRSKQKKVAVVLNVGGVIETGSWRGLADAILLAWQSGQEAGHSVADVLSGATNPCGKLATTFPMEYEDVPSSAGFPGTVLEGPDPEHRSFLSGDRAAEVVYSDGIWVGYRFYNTKSLNTAYPFGFGLSYTKFEYGKVEIDSDRFQDRVTASVSVRNAGKTAGREIVQAYVSAPGKRMKKPAIELKAFAKTRLLKPGDSETLRFVLKVENLVSFDADRSAWVAEQGEYTLRIGASSSDIKGTAAFVLPGDLVVENVRKALVPQQEIRDRFD